MTLRSPADPYVRAGAITSCTLQFGPLPKSVAITGGVLIATGAIATACSCAFFSIMLRAAKKDSISQEAIAVNPGYVAAPPPVSYQPKRDYDAPAIAYYTQPAPAYARPQMQVAVPQPMSYSGYAQPQASTYQPQAYQPQYMYYGRT